MPGKAKDCGGGNELRADELPEDERQELDRILAGPALANSPQLKAMLRYLVTETLAGRSARLKAFNIAVDVLGRSASFDPATDTIVRVQAGRLRAALARHYATETAAGPVRIELPKGSYVPVFVRRGAGTSPTEATGTARQRSGDGLEPSEGHLRGFAGRIRKGLRTIDWRSRRTLVAVLAAIVASAGLVAAAILFSSPGAMKAAGPSTPEPQIDALVLTPVHSLSSNRLEREFAKALAAELATELVRTEAVSMRVLTTDLDITGGGVSGSTGSQSVRWGLSGTLHRSGDLRRINIYLVDMTTRHVIWSQNYDTANADSPDALANAIILDLRPVLYRAAKQALATKARLSPHELFLLATWFPGAEFNSLAWQLERISLARKALAADPRSGHARSVLADKLTLLANLDPAHDTAQVWLEAAGYAREARALAPDSADVAFNLALYHLHAGELEAAIQSVQRTLELAPGHTLARFWSFVLPYTCAVPPPAVIEQLVRFDAGLAPSNPARWQTQAWLARLHLNSGSYREAMQAARRSLQILPNLGAAIVLMVASVETGDVQTARQVFEEQRTYWSTFSFDHYAGSAIARMCSGSPLLDTMLRLHTAAGIALDR